MKGRDILLLIQVDFLPSLEITIDQTIFLSILALVLFVPLPGSCSAVDDPIYIGVLLPLSGTEGEPLLDALMLGLEHVNGGGGIGGRPLELILHDTNSGDLQTYAEDLVHDPRIQVVIGPFSSDNIFQIADLFADYDKILISPTATSDEVYRAFAETGTVWRTATNDEEIISVVMQHLSSYNTKNVALLSVNNTYGRTFYDWVPFWAIETGITITGSEEYSAIEEIPDAVRRLCRNNPDFLIFITPTISGRYISAACDTLRELNVSTHLYLFFPNVDEHGEIWDTPDAGTLQRLFVSGMWNLEMRSPSSVRLPDNTLILMSKSWDQDFYQEFKTVSNIIRADYVTETYDALLAAAGVMARYTAYPKKSPMNAAKTVLTNGTGDPLPRTKEGFQVAYNLILNGESPIITGATGPLTFRPEGVDRLTPGYGLYRIEGGVVVPDSVEYKGLIKSGEIRDLTGNVSHQSSEVFEPPMNGDFWAVIGAFSRDWVNYRHQADALTMYKYLKERGVSDDHIILLVYDDIPEDQRNKKLGEVYHTPVEEEVRKWANPDYIGDTVNKQKLRDILSGNAMNNTVPLLQSDENSTVLLYLSSHGAQGGNLVFSGGREIVTPDEFSSCIDEMAKKKRFKRMLVVLESCFSEATALPVQTPGVIVMSASASNETSKSTTYDSYLGVWLSDEFTNQLISALRTADPSMSLQDLYLQVYRNVRSSHPRITFTGSLPDIPARTFFGGIL